MDSKTINSIKHNNKIVRREREQTQWFLRGSVITAYVHASKLTQLEDFTMQASQGFKCLQLTSKVSMNLYNKEIISPISSPQVFLTLVHSQFDEK